MIDRFRACYTRNERWIPAVFFCLGFAFDAVMLKRIDEPAVLIQQAAYIAVCAIFVGLELFREGGHFNPSGVWAKAWHYREALVHFLMGTLLNSYTIFYFKSASAATSYLFLAILVVILLMNEFKKFGESQGVMHLVLVALSIVSYDISLVPIFAGTVGAGSFIVSMALSCFFLLIYYRLLRTRLLPRQRRSAQLSFAGVPALFTVLYFLQLIPPVPLSISYMGIFHGVKKEGDRYVLSYNRPDWKFWMHGDQEFWARPGDVIYSFVRIYSPSRFNDRLAIAWERYDEKRGWDRSDAIPLPIVGGREEGYRGYSKKVNYQPGLWRVLVETADGREVGRIRFHVLNDTSPEPRPMLMEEQ